MALFENLITLTQVSDGAQGPSGSADQCRVETNVEEILQFKKDGVYEISPNVLTFKIIKNDERVEMKQNSAQLSFVSVTNPDVSYEITSDLILRDNVFEFNFQTLQETEQAQTAAVSESGEKSIKTVFAEQRFDPLVFIFSYVDEDLEIKIEKRMVFRNGLDKEMLDFSITASNITALTSQSKMTFGADGLTITNSGFKIQNNLKAENGEDDTITMLEATEDGILQLNGIRANTGQIGDFIISDGNLRSQDGALVLTGKDGLVQAENIQLGKRAKVDDLIAFEYGDAVGYLSNPDKYNGVLLSGNVKNGEELTQTLAIYANGNAKFGSIDILGGESIIRTDSWSLTPSEARFNNAVVSGTIKTSVFEQGTVQTVGSTMLFMPSYKIKDYEDGYFIFEQKTNLEKDMLVWLVDDENTYQVCKVNDIKDEGFSLNLVAATNDNEAVLTQANALVVIGKENTRALVFGINSGSAPAVNNLICARGLTINEFGNSSDRPPHLFLGDLSSIGKDGYGLYSDQVYLRGSLTTQLGSDGGATYAGINTNSGVQATIFSKFTDESKIVFWAGSKTEDDKDIQKAPFQVTETGSIYAARAELTDSIFINGTIEGADIYAARIHGNGTDSALSIYDTKGGIKFYTGYIDDKNQGTETCQINAKGFYTKDDKVSITFGKNNPTILNKKGLFVSLEDELSSGMFMESDTIQFKIIENQKIEISDQETKINNQLRVASTWFLGNTNVCNSKYQAVEDGYDLYIMS